MAPLFPALDSHLFKTCIQINLWFQVMLCFEKGAANEIFWKTSTTKIFAISGKALSSNVAFRKQFRISPHRRNVILGIENLIKKGLFP